MPASYTHQHFGNQVLSRIDHPKIVEIINNNRNYYNIGLQGPDILFFYHPLKNNYVNELGNRLHQEIARYFFEKAKEQLKETNSEAALAYIFGFINHFILDSECHGFIDTVMENKEISHYAIERDLDQRFMIINNDKFNYCSAKHLIANKDTATIIAPFFKLKPDTILTSLKSFRRFNQLFACQSNIKRTIILTGMKLVNAKSYLGMVMQAKPEPLIKDDIDILVNIFNQSINTATKEIIGYYESYLNNTRISNRFDFNYE